MSLAQGNNTPTRPRIEPGSPDPESDALTTRPVRPPPPSSSSERQWRSHQILNSDVIVTLLITKCDEWFITDKLFNLSFQYNAAKQSSILFKKKWRKKINLFYEIKYLILTCTINLVRRYKKHRSIFVCACFFLYSSFFATFDFTLLINRMLYLKNWKSDSTQNWNAFLKLCYSR